MLRNSSVTEQLVASQEGLNSMELGSLLNKYITRDFQTPCIRKASTLVNISNALRQAASAHRRNS
jgi:hypothetical protein